MLSPSVLTQSSVPYIFGPIAQMPSEIMRLCSEERVARLLRANTSSTFLLLEYSLLRVCDFQLEALEEGDFMQEEDASLEGTFEGYLMESWPDDPSFGILAAFYRAVAHEGPRMNFSHGDYIVRRGDPLEGVFKVEEGIVELEYIIDTEEDSDDEVLHFAIVGVA